MSNHKVIPGGELPYRTGQLKLDMKAWRERRRLAGKSVTTEMPPMRRRR